MPGESGFGSIDSWLQTGGAVATVVLFLRYLGTRDTAQRDIETERHVVLQAMSNQCHSHSLEITEAFVKAMDSSAMVVLENTRALGRVHQMMDSNIHEPHRRRKPNAESIDVAPSGTQKTDKK